MTTNEELNEKFIEAAKKGDVKEVARLITKGADLDAKNKYGNTALMQAAVYCHTDTVKFLVESGADLEAKDDNGNTALMCTAWGGHTDTVKFLENASEAFRKKKEDDQLISDAKEILRRIRPIIQEKKKMKS